MAPVLFVRVRGALPFPFLIFPAVTRVLYSGGTTRRLTMIRLLLILALVLTPGCTSVRATIEAARLVSNAVLDDASAAVNGISEQYQGKDKETDDESG